MSPSGERGTSAIIRFAQQSHGAVPEDRDTVWAACDRTGFVLRITFRITGP
jgi:hypothetical protein